MGTTTDRTGRSRRAASAVTALATTLPLGITAVMLAAAPAAQAAPAPLQWTTVVNNGVNPPGASIHFNSYSQPSISSNGVVVFRGRTQGNDSGGGGEGGGVAPLAPDAGGGGAVRGVYSRDMGTSGSPVVAVAQTGDTVPQPNNSDGHFNEFPSFPRISADGSSVVTRGQSTPVWTYTLNGTDTKVGTSGVYATVGGKLTTAASLLGAVPGYEYYAVPGAPAGTRFDQFPASPSIDGQKVAFKGNYAGASGELTGDYYTDLSSPGSAVQVIADSSTPIPGQPAGGTATFGSTAPPSAANGRVVFTGWDNEDTPTLGGIYLADLSPSPTLHTLASIGEQVPGEATGQTFRNFGEGLSFDGRFAAFWGTWGSETYAAHLTCSADGNKDLVAYCQQQYPNGYDVQIPVHQGIFVDDTSTGRVFPVAKTGTQFTDFTYWVFSGAPPGVGGSTDPTREPPRWRSSAFAAVSGLDGGAFQAAYKGTLANGTVGVYESQDQGTDPAALPSVVPVVDLTTPGQSIDPQAPAGSVVSAVGLERDGFRGRNLALSISMLNATTSESWAGIYLTKVEPSVTAQTITFDSTPPPAPVVGSSYTLAATASSGLPVTFSVDPTSTSGACTLDGSTVHLLKPGTCIIDADQPGNGTYQAAQRVQQVIQIAKAATTVSITLTPSTITATVSPVAPATGTPTGQVRFTRNGAYIGTAQLAGGVATLRFAVRPGMRIAADYLGDSTFAASTATITREDPTITATLSSAYPKTPFGWYRAPVTVTFTCTTHGAPLTAPCPAPVELSRNARNQSVSRTITATDGGRATVTVRNINIDQVPPFVRIIGVTGRGRPAPRCVAGDALSGLASCTISQQTSGQLTVYTATATDRAGNVATATASRAG